MLSLEPINGRTELGLFIMASSCSTRFIVVPSTGSMYLVQLDPSVHAPAFSCVCLTRDTVGYGIRITDEVSFRVVCNEPLPSSVKQLGGIVYSGNRTGLNCRTIDGKGKVVWLPCAGETKEDRRGTVQSLAFPWILYGENEIGESSEYFRFPARDHALEESMPPELIN